MMPTEGQDRAMEQLRAVAAASGGLVCVEVFKAPEKPGDSLLAKISLSCAGMDRIEGGLPLEDVEEVVVFIPPDFPFRYPGAWTLHDRFAGFPHVNWKRSLCLYQAPATEWDPSDGMFGYLDRLYSFYQQGALGQLDPVGAPLHPPVAYLGDGPVRTVIPRVNAPSVGVEPWFGTANLLSHSDLRVDIIGWSPFLDKDTPQGVAAALLLPTPFPYEFPERAGDLFQALADRGVSQERFFLTMQWAALHNERDRPLYVLIGTPMRGIRGGELRQHLTAWYISPTYAWALKTELDRHSEDAEARELGEKLRGILLEWARMAPIEWCLVQEDRPEVVVRRDQHSPLAWFAGRAVSVWGCGALGGHVAEHLARGGVRKLILRDNRTVTPGVLLRQPFEDSDIGALKVEALARRLRRIRPGIEIEVSSRSLLDEPLGGPDWVAGAELVIEATASTAVMSLLERRRSGSGLDAVPIVSMAIGHRAERGMVVVSPPSHSGGPLDVCRRLKLAACDRTDPAGFLDEFWPTARRPIFQPEPGCSDATFVGSSADVAGLAALMLNRAAVDLARAPSEVTATGHFLAQPHVDGAGVSWSSSFPADVVSEDVHAGYQVRISRTAWSQIRSWILRSAQARGRRVETGGLLFGERDEAAGVIWVSDVSGPPSDSSASSQRFICGVAGTVELNAEKSARTRGSVRYVGMWHTHPESQPLPSATDWEGMRRLVHEAGGSSRCLLLIVGRPHDRPMLGTYVFRAADFEFEFGMVAVRECVVRSVEWDDPKQAGE